MQHVVLRACVTRRYVTRDYSGRIYIGSTLGARSQRSRRAVGDQSLAKLRELAPSPTTPVICCRLPLISSGQISRIATEGPPARCPGPVCLSVSYVGERVAIGAGSLRKAGSRGVPARLIKPSGTPPPQLTCVCVDDDEFRFLSSAQAGNGLCGNYLLLHGALARKDYDADVNTMGRA
ncbi:hypothetical protein NUW54_g13099 [Trametes sanguinea]|uniref:Uncharacterized protein n=1 Tax=Trametes sanguinea TaxID=158606 RepID=A0ACC1MPV7_9APHY|nr:hypothetical protein NUW54_g13099 [Trametes sanguinea]